LDKKKNEGWKKGKAGGNAHGFKEEIHVRGANRPFTERLGVRAKRAKEKKPKTRRFREGEGKPCPLKGDRDGSSILGPKQTERKKLEP